MSKVFTKILDLHIEPYYIKYMPSVQCGAVPRKGTDFATHLVRSAVDYAALMGKSVALIFIDLIKAFDFAIRELAIGWPQLSEMSHVDHLCNLGLSRDRAQTVAGDIDSNGCILDQLQAHPHIIQMVSSLHTKSWFQFGSAADVLVVEKGGRQGCRFGGKLFNFASQKRLLKSERSSTKQASFFTCVLLMGLRRRVGQASLATAPCQSSTLSSLMTRLLSFLLAALPP